uniref:Ankyrin repeat-containing protein n=1 Tax=Borely moumouvirus TaxID=2712067 RepID=A0A6G6AB27_9VIRU
MSKLYFKLIKDSGCNFDNSIKYEEGLCIINDFRINDHDWILSEELNFIDIDKIWGHLHDCIYLYDVFLPIDNIELKIHDYGNGTYSANMIILKNKKDLRDIQTWKYLLSLEIGIHGLSLKWACENGVLNVVKYLVDYGIDICHRNHALDIACEYGHIDIIKYLIENDTNVKNSALFNASINGHLGVVIYLTDYGLKINEEMFDFICATGQIEIIKYIINNGTDISMYTQTLKRSIACGKLEVIKYLVENYVSIKKIDNALLQACFRGFLDIVQYLVDCGANIHAKNNWAIISASEFGHLEVVKYLVKNGADIHAENNYALKKALEKNHTDVVQYLIECDI